MPTNPDYPWIRAYGRFMGSFQYYIDAEVHQARQDNAPQNATRRNEDGSWATTNDIINPTMRAQMGLPPLPQVPEPEAVEYLPVVNAIKLPYKRGQLRQRYMVLCYREPYGQRLGFQPWVVWHAGWNDHEWVADNGEYFTDPTKAVRRLKARATECGANA